MLSNEELLKKIETENAQHEERESLGNAETTLLNTTYEQTRFAKYMQTAEEDFTTITFPELDHLKPSTLAEYSREQLANNKNDPDLICEEDPILYNKQLLCWDFSINIPYQSYNLHKQLEKVMIYLNNIINNYRDIKVICLRRPTQITNFYFDTTSEGEGPSRFSGHDNFNEHINEFLRNVKYMIRCINKAEMDQYSKDPSCQFRFFKSANNRFDFAADGNLIIINTAALDFSNAICASPIEDIILSAPRHHLHRSARYKQLMSFVGNYIRNTGLPMHLPMPPIHTSHVLHQPAGARYDLGQQYAVTVPSEIGGQGGSEFQAEREETAGRLTPRRSPSL